MTTQTITRLEPCTWAELCKLSFKISPYQRPYSWGSEKAISFIRGILENGISDIGTIIVQEDDKEGKLEVIDGQQRLITLSIYAHWKKDKHDKQNTPPELSLIPSIDGIKDTISKQNIIQNLSAIARYFSNRKKENAPIRLEDISLALYSVHDSGHEYYELSNLNRYPLKISELLKSHHYSCMTRCGDKGSAREEMKRVEGLIRGDLSPEDYLSGHSIITTDGCKPFLTRSFDLKNYKSVIDFNTFVDSTGEGCTWGWPEGFFQRFQLLQLGTNIRDLYFYPLDSWKMEEEFIDPSDRLKGSKFCVFSTDKLTLPLLSDFAQGVDFFRTVCLLALEVQDLILELKTNFSSKSAFKCKTDGKKEKSEIDREVESPYRVIAKFLSHFWKIYNNSFEGSADTGKNAKRLPEPHTGSAQIHLNCLAALIYLYLLKFVYRYCPQEDERKKDKNNEAQEKETKSLEKTFSRPKFSEKIDGEHTSKFLAPLLSILSVYLLHSPNIERWDNSWHRDALESLSRLILSSTSPDLLLERVFYHFDPSWEFKSNLEHFKKSVDSYYGDSDNDSKEFWDECLLTANKISEK